MKAVEAKYSDEKYYERVPLEAFEEEFVDAKTLGCYKRLCLSLCC